MTIIEVIKGDITKLSVDAIVNSANSSLLGGGGVDGAIHRAAGYRLLKECKTLNGCKTGQSKITNGYNLPAKYIIHTVGPVWKGGDNDEKTHLTNCYISALDLAIKNNIKTIAFPSISCGIYGFPINEACKIAVQTVKKYIQNYCFFEKIIFIDLNPNIISTYNNILKDNDSAESSKNIENKLYSTINNDLEAIANKLDIPVNVLMCLEKHLRNNNKSFSSYYKKYFESKYRNIKYKDIRFVAYSEYGAMGDRGSINILADIDNKLTHCYGNMCYGKKIVNLKDLALSFPPIINPSRYLHNSSGNINEWNHFDLGMGNHLLVSNQMYEYFILAIGSNRGSYLYQTWFESAIKTILLLKKGYTNKEEFIKKINHFTLTNCDYQLNYINLNIFNNPNFIEENNKKEKNDFITKLKKLCKKIFEK